MNLCETCKHWVEHKQTETEYMDHQCTNPKVGDGDADKSDELRVEADWIAGVTTGPKFGCIHHEPREPEKPRESYCVDHNITFTGFDCPRGGGWCRLDPDHKPSAGIDAEQAKG